MPLLARMDASTAALVAGVLLLASTAQISGAAVPSTAAVGPSIATNTATATDASGVTSTPFCSVTRTVLLSAGSPEPSARLRLTPGAAPTPADFLDAFQTNGAAAVRSRSCRLQVSAPASNLLSVELVPLLPDDQAARDGDDSGSSSPSSEDDAEDGDRYTGNGDDSKSDSVNVASGNMGLMLAGLLQQDAARKQGSVNASCTLSLYVDGEVAWSVDLCDTDAVFASRNHIKNFPHNFSLVWTPPSPSSRRRLKADSVIVRASRKGVPTENLCSVQTVRLAKHGMESAIALRLRAPDDMLPDTSCRVNIAAPTFYMLSLLLVSAKARTSSDESNAESDLASGSNNAASEDSKPSCRLSLLLGCSSEYWSVDLCDAASAQLALNFTEVFPHNVSLVWTPPPPSQRHHQLATTVILTALGRGKMCSHSQFYPCWRRPRAHPLCVSHELACDGYHNCPMDGNDEDPTMCRNIEVPGQEKESEGSRSDIEGYVKELLAEHYLRHRPNNHSHRSEETSFHGDSTPDTLSNYGPWGYLMLGMLVCGAFLMLCGLWECCCRQPKATPGSSAPSHTPTAVLMPQPAVLALDSDLEDDPSRPPAYEELDQPPAYGALFPGQPKDDVVVPTSLHADSTFPDMDADDVPTVTTSQDPS